MADIVIKDAIRRFVLFAICAVILLFAAKIRLGGELTLKRIGALGMALGPMLGFWILLDGIPLAVSVSAYRMRLPLSLSPFVLISVIPYACAAGLITLSRSQRGRAIDDTPGKRTIVMWGVGAAVVASVVGFVVSRIVDPAGAVLWSGGGSYVALSIALFPLVAFVEEFVYRRSLWEGSRSVVGIPLAAIVSSGVFAAAHGSTGAWLFVLFGAGEVFRAAYERLGGLRGAIVTHWLFNAVSALIQIAWR
jgi:membrane protease YdiL (CAAX protease family)